MGIKTRQQQQQIDPRVESRALALRAAEPVASIKAIHGTLVGEGITCRRRDVQDALARHGMGEPLTRSIRLRLSKPVDGRWEDVEPWLHALRSVMSRIRDAVTMEVVAADRAGDKPKTTKAARAALAEIQKHTKNEHIRALDVAASVIDAIQSKESAAARTYLAKRWGKSGQKPPRIPSAHHDSPIFVRDNNWALQVNGHLALSVKLAGGRAPHHRFVCAALRGPHWAIVRALAAGSPEHRAGDLKLVYSSRKDRKTGRKRGWEAIITVTSAAPLRQPGAGVMAVHRGAHNFLFTATGDGLARPLVTGDKLVEAKKRFRGRRQALKRAMRERGTGARGRGVARRFATYDALGDKEGRMVRTYCQQAAAALVKLAVERGVGTIVREDYGGIKPDEDAARYIEHAGFKFPYYQLGECIDWSAKKAGLVVDKVPAEYISTTCLRCGSASDKYRSGDMFHCGGCGFDRPADFVAALHLLKRSGADMSAWEARFKAVDELASAVRVEARADEERPHG